ncbi:putative nuclease HARBI1 [Ornithodoros turicata]|uniref:putative nuclease HARBI1 n=1 Tax=Ornithodoros turicata TaxID=34597 RepID=UPI003139EE72
MSLSKATSAEIRGRDKNFFLCFAQLQCELRRRQCELNAVRNELDRQHRKRKRAQQQLQTLTTVALRLCTRQRELRNYRRPASWWETTLPGLPDDYFKSDFRVTRATFNYLVEVCQSMAKADTHLRKAIPLRKRVAVALYRLSSSAEDRTVANLFGVSRSFVNIVYREFCAQIVSKLEAQFVKLPTDAELPEHLRRFEAVTGFPQGFGALDGCHIEVCPPKDQGSDYYNYKGWYSVILLAIADHTYKFSYVNVGSPGRNHDSAVLQRSRLPAVINSTLFNTFTVSLQGVDVGPVILCDQAFPLQQHLMKPYPDRATNTPQKQEFNARLSGARRVVENAFGRLKARFRILHKGLECDIDNCTTIIRVCCILHNICEDLNYGVEQHWIEECRHLPREMPQHHTSAATESGACVRDAIAQHLYCMKTTA